MVLVLLVVATGCARSYADPGPTGLFDVGDGRTLFLECQGAGSPTVFIIPGKGSYAEAWNVVVPPNDPIRSSPYDIITEAKLVPSPDAAQPTVARTTRVCAYDRPNTRPDGPDRSTEVPQPHALWRPEQPERRRRRGRLSQDLQITSLEEPFCVSSSPSA